MASKRSATGLSQGLVCLPKMLPRDKWVESAMGKVQLRPVAKLANHPSFCRVPCEMGVFLRLSRHYS
jgi:hypothetical protein